MLELSLNGNVIPVPADFSMPMVINTSFCNFEKIPFCYAIDFSLPENEWTRKYFGHPERFTKKRTGKDQTLPGFRAAFSGTTFISGSLKINGFNNGSYNLTAIDNVGVLSEEQQNKTILDIEKFKEPIPWVNSANYSEEDSPYACFPVNNLNFFKDKGVIIERDDITAGNMELLKWLHIRSGSGQMNDIAEDGTIKAVANTIDGTDLSQKHEFYKDGVVTVVTPFFFLNWLIKSALKEFKFFVDENHIDSDDDLKRCVVYNNYDLTLTTFSKTTEYFEDWVDDNNVRHPGLGHFEMTGYVFNRYIRSYPEVFKIANHLPKMTIGELLVSTQNYFNLVFDFKPNNKVDVLHREAILKGESVDLDIYFIDRWYPDDKKNFSLKFTHEVDDNDLIFSEKYTDLSDRKADIKEPVETWDDLLTITDPEEGEIRFVKSGQQFAEYKWYTPEKTDEETLNYTTKDVIGWQQISIGFQNGWWQYGRDETEEIKTKWSTCYGFGTTVSVLQQGNMNAWKAKQQAFSPRLLIYQGNNTGGPESATLSLDYEKETIGIIPKFWKRTAQWWSERLPVTGSFDLPANILKHVIYNKCKKFRTREGEFIIEELRFTLFVDHISETTVKGYKV